MEGINKKDVLILKYLLQICRKGEKWAVILPEDSTSGLLHIISAFCTFGHRGPEGANNWTGTTCSIAAGLCAGCSGGECVLSSNSVCDSHGTTASQCKKNTLNVHWNVYIRVQACLHSTVLKHVEQVLWSCLSASNSQSETWYVLFIVYVDDPISFKVARN